jgi:hypothetical protein
MKIGSHEHMTYKRLVMYGKRFDIEEEAEIPVLEARYGAAQI